MRVIVNGAQGKMGTLACKAIDDHPQFELVATLGRGDNLVQAIKTQRADIVIDLTRADSVFENSLNIINANARPIIGTSGLDQEQIELLKQKCNSKKLGGLIIPNFSISAVLMMRFAAEAAKFLPMVEIIEAHHEQKFDAPSGTAIKTAELIAQARKTQQNKPDVKELINGVRGGEYQGIPIHSLRLPGVIANQQVIFGSPAETLTLTHNTLDRSCFMPGLILACQKVIHLDSLYYGLEHVL